LFPNINNTNMDIQNLIRSRRTIHDYVSEDFISRDDIKSIIETACWAPNHHLTEPWHYYLLGQETIDEVCELNRSILLETKGKEVAEEKTERWKKIPGWLVVTCNKSNDQLRFMEDYAACACAMQNIMLSLWEKGFGSKWSTGEITRKKEFYDSVWIDQSLEQIMGILWYGKPDLIPQTARQPVAQFITELP